MKTPRKALKSAVCVASVAALFFSTSSAIRAQDATQEKRVALKTADGKYVSTADQGGLNLGSRTINNRTVFALVDANGATLDDGDEVTIKYYPSATSKPSFWQEREGKIIRDKESKDASGKFKLKKQGEKGFVLQTGSGKFIALKDNVLGLADAAEGALVFTIEEQSATAKE